MVWSHCCLCVALLWPLSAQALKLRLCVDSRPHPPFLTPDGGGNVGLLVKLAAAESGIELELYSAPVTRCRAEIAAGLADGYPSASYTPSLLPLLHYPMKDGRPDAARSVLLVRVMAFRRVGGQVEWDGARFAQLKTPVLVGYGSVMMIDRLTAMGQGIDAESRSLDATFAKLMAGRGDVALGWEVDGRALLAKPGFAGKVEALAPPFAEELYYLGLSKRFYQSEGDAAERLWNAIGRIKQSAPYLAAIKPVQP